MRLPEELESLLTLDANWRNETVNLNASENYTSLLVKKIIGLHPSYDFYAFPPSGGTIDGPWNFLTPPYLQLIDQHINQLAKQLLNCEVLDARPKGGQAAEISILAGLAKSGNSVFYVQESDGGHFGLNFISQKMGVQLIPVYFDNQTFQIDIHQTISLMRQVWKKDNSQKLVIIGQSFILNQQPLLQFSETLKNEFSNVILTYDVSHTLGLIIGKQFINPILQGVDLIHGSTHKTFPGPQKAIVGFPSQFDKNLKTLVQNAISPGLQSNSGTSETLALAVAFEEMKIYGQDYAKAVCSHARYLATLLDTYGFTVAGKSFGFTDTHQIWIVIGDEINTWKACSDLHQAGIRSYPAFLPFVKRWGLRISTNAVTRLGFDKDQIKQVAHWIKKIIIDKEPGSQVISSVKALMKEFPINHVKYTFPLAIEDDSIA